MIDRIYAGDKGLAVIIRCSFHKEGIHFFTPDELSQQLGNMNRPGGYVVPPHVHNPVSHEGQYTK